MRVTRPSILITDDDRDFRETVRGVLEPQGFRTLTAGDGEEAFQIIRNQPVHLVLLDMHMPKLTGLETLRLVKQFKSLLPCILLSGQLDEMIRREAAEAHAFQVLAKPITRQELVEAIAAALERTYHWPRS